MGSVKVWLVVILWGWTLSVAAGAGALAHAMLRPPPRPSAPHPAHHPGDAAVLAEQRRRIESLLDGYRRARADADSWEKAVLSGDDVRRKEADLRRKLCDLAEQTIVRTCVEIHDAVWLRGDYTIRERADAWLVEGITLESRGATMPPWAYLWGVEIRRDAHDVPGEPYRVVFHLDVQTDLDGDGRWTTEPAIKLKPDAPYPITDFPGYRPR